MVPVSRRENCRDWTVPGIAHYRHNALRSRSGGAERCATDVYTGGDPSPRSVKGTI
ncbi:MAG: hypothetical protein ABEH64_04085 [Salinirussus sp.]